MNIYEIAYRLNELAHEKKYNIEQLVIVSHLKANQLVLRYIKYLNKICSVPIHYIQFDYEKNDVLHEIGF
jgi:hypothetical protein